MPPSRCGSSSATRGAGQFSWWSATCQTCGKVKRGSLPFTAERAILKHAVKEHGGLVYADGRLYEISFTTTRARDRRPREDGDRPEDDPLSGP